MQSFGIGSSIKNGILAGLRQASFWTMKHRARTVGEQGMHAFLSQLQQNCDPRIHLMGHSFGCIVVSSILGGPDGTTPLPRPVESAALVQGAFSLWSYADTIPDVGSPGYFHLVPGTVSGPIITTQSRNDTAVGGPSCRRGPGGRSRVWRRRAIAEIRRRGNRGVQGVTGAAARAGADQSFTNSSADGSTT